ncbi:monofunctional biosynthetic peptidoglycan transglycosylase [Hyphococcus flavus]|uniref:Biosynthetic peptidoglycan transglycosylase n=1 Tax=Hyphococcus flavus TaxID=1866326 RepID=A0AAF0CEK4_9PROT|nr:monofunctional biosynthetic peptidoglycan transglycosylase [Hyphococcus flavus]WDI30329.1 monofunctional biosynthetic peptidoglycan transglycosylase [Hyphococcus flavus]
MALTAPKRKRKRRSKKKKLQSRLKRYAIAAGLAVVALFAFSVLWAGVYRVAPPPGTLVMAARGLGGDKVNKQWVRLEDISPHLVTAVIAAEDTRFCLHNGIDFEAIDKALAESKNGGRLRGASTISQQTAKNAFFWNGGGWVRKGGEAWMTVLIETLWPKRRIMEVYLNVAEWGDGIFGAEAAAQSRFGKSAKDLNAYEAALLASVLPSPDKWRVDPPGPYVRKRSGTVRARMNVVRRDGLDACVTKH